MLSRSVACAAACDLGGGFVGAHTGARCNLGHQRVVDERPAQRIGNAHRHRGPKGSVLARESHEHASLPFRADGGRRLIAVSG